jgi:hypothetical protein
MIAINCSWLPNITFLSRKETPDSPSPSLETAKDVQENGYKINVCYRHLNYIFERSQEGMVAILAKRCMFASGDPRFTSPPLATSQSQPRSTITYLNYSANFGKLMAFAMVLPIFLP